MRPLLLLFMSALCVGAYAADLPKPTDFPPPPIESGEAVDEPQVTIIQQKEQTVEEFRLGGRLYMIKVTPKTGKPYYMVDDRGDGNFTRMDSMDSRVRPPRWVIHNF